MTNKISAILLIAFVAYIGVCSWANGQRADRETLQSSPEQHENI